MPICCCVNKWTVRNGYSWRIHYRLWIRLWQLGAASARMMVVNWRNQGG